MQRSWGKVKSGPKKALKKPGDAMRAAAIDKTSPFDGLPFELQLAGEALAESIAAKKVAEPGPEPEDDGFYDPFADADEAEEDDGFVMPEMTPEILAMMFKNMNAAGKWTD